MQLRTPLLTIALATAALGCSGSDESAPPETAPPETAPADSGPAETAPAETAAADPVPTDTSVAALLARIPLAALDDPDGRGSETVQISVGDTARAAELAGLPRPAADDLDASVQWYVDLSNAGSIEQGGTGYSFDGPDFPQFSAAIAIVEEIEAELGFTPFAIDSYATVVALPTQMAVFAGDLPLADDLIAVGDGIVSAGDGEDFQQDLEGRTALRPIGQPHRIAESDGLVAISLSTPLIEAWLAGGDTLADDPDLAAAAQALDAGGAVTATLVMSAFEPFDAAGAAPSPIASAFSVVGIGTAEVDGAPGNVIVYVFATADDAAGALPVIDDGWRNGVTVGSNQPTTDAFDIVSVEQDDRVVVVTANVTDSVTTRRALSMLVRGEPLFTHSG